MPRVLISLPGGEGVIVGANGAPELTHDVRSDRGQRLAAWDPFKPMRVGLGGHRMLFGGLLPEGAVSAEGVEATGVRRAASVGPRTWALILHEAKRGDPAIGFRDAAGAFVHRPMPALYPHHPVDDAEDPCPVCDSVEYEVFFPTEEWRAGRGRKGSEDYEPSPLVVCRVCGHQETTGGVFRFPRNTSYEGEADRAARVARLRAEQTAQRWYVDKMTLLGLAFPVFAAEGWPARISHSGSHGEDLTSLTVAHSRRMPDSLDMTSPRLEVTTSIHPSADEPLSVARALYAARIAGGEQPQTINGALSDAALALWFRGHRRRRVAASCIAEVGETQIIIASAPETFLTVGSLDDLWVAVCHYHGATLTVVSRQIHPAAMRLTPLDDPEGCLLGPAPDEP